MNDRIEKLKAELEDLKKEEVKLWGEYQEVAEKAKPLREKWSAVYYKSQTIERKLEILREIEGEILESHRRMEA